MKKAKMTSLIACSALCLTGHAIAASRTWTGGNSGGSWSNPANWNSYPTGADNVRFSTDGDYATIDSDIGYFERNYQQGYGAGLNTTVDMVDGGMAHFDKFRLAHDAGTTASFNLSGGELTISGGNHGVGYRGTGILNQSGGLFLSTNDLKIGKFSTARGYYNMSGGQLSVDSLIRLGTANASALGDAYGELNVSGGQVETFGLGINNGELNVVGGTVDSMITFLYGGTNAYASANLASGALFGDVLLVGHHSDVTIQEDFGLHVAELALTCDGVVDWKGMDSTSIEDMAAWGQIYWTNAHYGYGDTRAFDGEILNETGQYLRYANNADGSGVSMWTVIPEPSTIGLLALCAPMLMVFRRLRG